MKKPSYALASGLLLALTLTSAYAQQPGTRPNQTTTNSAPGTNNSGSTHQGNQSTTNSPANSGAGTNAGMNGTGTTGMTQMSMEEMDRLNKQGAAAVAAITPTSQKLSKADQDLMNEVAMGGMMQLEMSRVAVDKAQDPQVKQLAQAEVEEQTGLSDKLKEIAQAKGVTLPSAPDAKSRAMLTEMQSASGADFDRQYVRESGVKGHEKLDKVMSKVEAKATDANMKALASAAHPLVKTHLQAAQTLLNSMGNGNGMNSGTNRSSGSEK